MGSHNAMRTTLALCLLRSITGVPHGPPYTTEVLTAEERARCETPLSPASCIAGIGRRIRIRGPDVRAVALGGSITAGQGVADGDRWTERLEARLNASGVAARVVNRGYHGADVCSFAAKATEKIVGWCREIRCNAFFVETAVNDHNRVALETGRCAEALVRILSEAVPDVAIVFADVPSVKSPKGTNASKATSVERAAAKRPLDADALRANASACAAAARAALTFPPDHPPRTVPDQLRGSVPHEVVAALYGRVGYASLAHAVAAELGTADGCAAPLREAARRRAPIFVGPGSAARWRRWTASSTASSPTSTCPSWATRRSARSWRPTSSTRRACRRGPRGCPGPFPSAGPRTSPVRRRAFHRPKDPTIAAGNPYGCDALSAQIAGPFPMSVDQSACLGAVPTPFALEGLAPRGARYWSIQVFAKKAANPLNERRGGAADDDGSRRTHTLFDGDLSLDGDGRYAVAVGAAAAVAGFKDVIDVGDATKCLVVIRCLKLPEGRRWRAPAVRALPGGAPWPARDVERRCGQLATAEAPRGPAARLRGCVWINAAAVALRPELARALVAGAALAVSLRSALSRALATKYRRDRGRGVPNRDVRAIAGLGGCAGHLYWSGPYDAREGDVAVTFVVDAWVPGSPPGLRYAALNVYAWTSLPLPSFVDVDSAVAAPPRSLASGDRVRSCDAILTTRPTGARDNEVDVSDAPEGCFTVRALHPPTDAIAEACVPTVRFLGARSLA